jgi:hypothetical protein
VVGREDDAASRGRDLRRGRVDDAVEDWDRALDKLPRARTPEGRPAQAPRSAPRTKASDDWGLERVAWFVVDNYPANPFTVPKRLKGFGKAAKSTLTRGIELTIDCYGNALCVAGRATLDAGAAGLTLAARPERLTPGALYDAMCPDDDCNEASSEFAFMLMTGAAGAEGKLSGCRSDPASSSSRESGSIARG